MENGIVLFPCYHVAILIVRVCTDIQDNHHGVPSAAVRGHVCRKYPQLQPYSVISSMPYQYSLHLLWSNPSLLTSLSTSCLLVEFPMMVLCRCGQSISGNLGIFTTSGTGITVWSCPFSVSMYPLRKSSTCKFDLRFKNVYSGYNVCSKCKIIN